MKVSQEYKDKSICVLGLGYVGLTLAVTMADVGFKVLGVEIRESVVDLIRNGKAHFHEPGLEDRLRRVVESGAFLASTSIPASWKGSVYIITVGTPLDKNKKSRVDMIKNVTQDVATVVKDGDLIIMRSTLKLGVTRNVVMPILEKSGCKYELAFCPERTLEGRALVELRTLPQIVGGLTDDAGVRASQLFQFVTPTVVRVSDIETAEMIKLIDNAQRDVAFAYANEVAEACDAIGISAIEVIRAGKLGYPRTNLPVPGPVGGPCLEKDSHILAEGLMERGCEPQITIAARTINENQPFNVVSAIGKVCAGISGFSKNPKISLLGLAFKGIPQTDDLRGTMARPIFEALKKHFPSGQFYGFDAVVSPEEIENFGLIPQATMATAFSESSLVLILNNHPIFENMNIFEYSNSMAKPGLIYDFWNLYDSSQLSISDKVGYMALGSHGRVIFSK